jgi:hypothetical protein
MSDVEHLRAQVSLLVAQLDACPSCRASACTAPAHVELRQVIESDAGHLLLNKWEAALNLIEVVCQVHANGDCGRVFALALATYDLAVQNADQRRVRKRST